ncbi:hypothetical protein RN70_08475 [Staphylococcus schleiferi]|nr:hypothetical protein OA96_07790 [Staphylococcus schleiferi]AKS73931.1 hypothetical protein RN70_08475 [Staphylococcus schleiferi]
MYCIYLLVIKIGGKNYEKNDFLIVGDSLTSDIQGGINAGIDTCWYNHRQLHNKTAIKPTYTIQHIQDLIQILR